MKKAMTVVETRMPGSICRVASNKINLNPSTELVTSGMESMLFGGRGGEENYDDIVVRVL